MKVFQHLGAIPRAGAALALFAGTAGVFASVAPAAAAGPCYPQGPYGVLTCDAVTDSSGFATTQAPHNCLDSLDANNTRAIIQVSEDSNTFGRGTPPNNTDRVNDLGTGSLQLTEIVTPPSNPSSTPGIWSTGFQEVQVVCQWIDPNDPTAHKHNLGYISNAVATLELTYPSDGGTPGNDYNNGGSVTPPLYCMMTPAPTGSPNILSECGALNAYLSSGDLAAYYYQAANYGSTPNSGFTQGQTLQYNIVSDTPDYAPSAGNQASEGGVSSFALLAYATPTQLSAQSPDSTTTVAQINVQAINIPCPVSPTYGCTTSTSQVIPTVPGTPGHPTNPFGWVVYDYTQQPPQLVNLTDVDGSTPSRYLISNLTNVDISGFLVTAQSPATPELDSLLLFGAGAAGLAGYARTRFMARRRTGSDS